MSSSDKVFEPKEIDPQNLCHIIGDFARSRDRYYFRGEPEFGWSLLPSLLRKPSYKRLRKQYKAKNPVDLETRLIQRFTRYTSHIYHAHSDFHGRQFSDLETLCVAQHNGLPTLLLDWTLNPLVALYFALRSHQYQEPKTEDAALWVMKLAPKEDRKELTVYLESPSCEWEQKVEENRLEHPLLVIPLVFTRRIAAQEGRFVYAACLESDGQGIQQEKAKDNSARKPWSKLECYKIPGKHRQKLLHYLNIVGVHEGTLMTDLEGWAKYLRDGNL